MTIDFYTTQKLKNLIFTEAHLKRGGRLISMEGTAGTCLATQFYRATGVPQWSKEKGRYLTFDEWEKLQQYWETHQPELPMPGKHHEGHRCPRLI